MAVARDLHVSRRGDGLGPEHLLLAPARLVLTLDRGPLVVRGHGVDREVGRCRVLGIVLKAHLEIVGLRRHAHV